MRKRKIHMSCYFAAFCALMISCNDHRPATIQIGENTFVHKDKVYRIIDNQITELGSLESDSISKSTVLDPKLKNYNDYALDFVAHGAYTHMTAVYRGDVLYFNLRVNGLNNLRDKYRGGNLTINFIDEYGFEIGSTEVGIGDLTQILGSGKETLRFEYNGRSKMSSEMYKSIYTYSVSSSLVEKGRYGW
jgi:hypothetical protein